MEEPPVDLWYASNRVDGPRHAWKYVLCGTVLNGCLLAAAFMFVVDDVPSEDPYVRLRQMLGLTIGCVTIAQLVVAARELVRYKPAEWSTLLAAVIAVANLVCLMGSLLWPVRY